MEDVKLGLVRGFVFDYMYGLLIIPKDVNEIIACWLLAAMTTVVVAVMTWGYIVI